MARNVSAGFTGGSPVGGLQAFKTTLTTRDNLDIVVDPAGTGRFIIAGDAQIQNQSDLRFADLDNSNWVAFQAPEVVSSNYTLTLPTTIASSAGLALISDSSGNLSWGVSGSVLTNNNTDSNTNFLVFTTQSSGGLTTSRVSTSGLTFQPSTGTFTATAIVESSSITLKENISPIENALEIVLKLEGVVYDRKDGSKKGEAGLIAEQVNEVLPNLVTKNSEGDPIGINYTKFSAYLIEAVKSLKQEIDALKGKKQWQY
jgi:hypothetical protein